MEKNNLEGVDIHVAFFLNRIWGPLNSFGNLSQKSYDFMARLKRLKGCWLCCSGTPDMWGSGCERLCQERKLVYHAGHNCMLCHLTWVHLREREDFCRDNKWNMNAVNRGSSLMCFVAHRQKAWTDWREIIGQSSVKMLQLYYSLKIVILHSLIKCVTASTVKHAVVTCNLLPAGNLFENVQHFLYYVLIIWNTVLHGGD